MITENLSTLKIHRLTQEQYDRELAAGNLDPNAMYLTPDKAIDLTPYATIEQLDTKADVGHTHEVAEVNGLQGLIDGLQASYDSHTSNKENPHGVTKEQIGLANVDDTADLDKPVSYAMQAALDEKADVSHTQAASTITAGTFAGQVVANSSNETPSTMLLRNSKLVPTETTPTVNGEICWLYE